MKNNTINKKEIEKFSKIAEEWWDPNGKFKPLHKFNPIRIKYIRDTILSEFKIKKEHQPFKGISILDIGCGGGLLSEPMARLGADVVGIDASFKNIQVAKYHLKKSKLKIKYYNSSPENLKIKKRFDIILNMEIVEHVEDVDFFIKESSKFLKKSGVMFIATLNKTLKSYLFAIVGAEYVLKWLPIGTHDWEKFVKPEYLTDICKKNSLKLKKIDGMTFNPELSLRRGNYSKFKPNKLDIISIKKGKAYFNKTKSLDHVQAIVVKDGKILAKEGREGTKKMLSELKKNSDGILIKLPKKKQDLRMDLPTVGLQTFKDIKKYGLRGVVLQSKKNIFLDKIKCIKFANKNKIFINII